MCLGSQERRLQVAVSVQEPPQGRNELASAGAFEMGFIATGATATNGPADEGEARPTTAEQAVVRRDRGKHAAAVVGANAPVGATRLGEVLLDLAWKARRYI